MFSLDNYLVEKTTFIIKLFKYVHPNYLTLLGGILNFVLIYDLYFSDKIIFPILVFILRVLLDIYDGAVARYFNKSSKIGGIFDTVSDLILAFFLILYILNKVFNISFIFSFILTIIFLLKILHIMKINNSQWHTKWYLACHKTWYIWTHSGDNNYYIMPNKIYNI